MTFQKLSPRRRHERSATVVEFGRAGSDENAGVDHHATTVELRLVGGT